jgi:hypothetical protein
MEFIRNTFGSTGKLEAIHRAAIKDAECVLAAVAYVTQDRPFLEVCWQERKPLTLYARYDHTGPVAPGVLDWFHSKTKQSANYQIRFVPDIFHPKIIWWKKVGAYIGSANLTDAAWFKNFEAGLFLTEEEIIDADFYDDLDDYFYDIHQASHPVTKEIEDEIKEIHAKGFSTIDYKAQKEFNKKRQIPERPSLISITRVPGRDRKKAKFLAEWSQTLQYLRDISERLSLPENRPKWIPDDTPKGVLADQFLHAYYYNKVRDGRHSQVEEFYQKNHKNRDAALTEAINWWRGLDKAPSNEDVHITQWAPEVRRRLVPGAVVNMSESDFVEMCIRIHAMLEHARQMGSSEFGLTHQLNKMTKPERAVYFSKWLFKQKSPNGSNPRDVIDYVLHGGALNETSERLFKACNDTDLKILHMGVSMLGEMIGWAMPDDFPPRNGRTSKGLKALGFDVTIHSGG